MSAEKVLAEKQDSIPLPATEYHQSQRRKGRFLRLSLYVLVALLGIKAIAHRFAPHGSKHRFQSLEHHHRLTVAEREKLFLSVPSSESALAASRAYATHPHLAGSSEDLNDAKVMLDLFHKEFNIPMPSAEPIFAAGTPESRNATLRLTSRETAEPSAWIDTYYPVLNTPLDRSLQILGEDGEAVWTADLVEDGDPLDEDAHRYKDSVPTWHGLSKGGDAEGELVYANYGTKEDYDELVAAGSNLTGKIVIVRYGAVFRGLKIKGAQELGAAGVLIYSDPRDDGYVTVENGFAPYPAGPARNPTSVQRGSVQFLSMYPGDPTTPGYPAYKDADREDGSNIPKIPSLPISWQNAERLLEEIGELYAVGKDGKKTLSGNASKSKIKLVNHVDTKITPIWNTMASIPGHIRDEVVIIGCHRDAWVMGAADPTSGTVSLHEIIRGFGALLRKGWKPLRTVVFASWDAEEYGLVGSTEWGEDFPEWISKHTVAYLNVDVSVSGSRWEVGGSPSLANLIQQTALEVPHPTVEGKTLWDARNDEGPFTGAEGPSSNLTIDADVLEAYNVAKRNLHASKTGVAPLGSGSDFTVFLQRLGVASSNEGFGGTPTDAVYHYHSIYDSQRFQEVYADPGFHRHVVVAKHLGLQALRIIDSIIVPLNTTQYAFELDDYLGKVQALAHNLRASVAAPDFSKLQKVIRKVQDSSQALDEEKRKAEKELKHALRKLSSPHHHMCRKWHRLVRRVADGFKKIFGVQPHHYRPVPELEVDAWTKFLFEYDGDEVRPSTAVLSHPRHGHSHRMKKLIKAAKRVVKANRKIIAFERGFISEDGIKDREWYKHLGVAPGKWLGYGATTFPALTEALVFDQNTTLAQYEVDRLAQLLKKLAHEIQP
ncbi:putative vacuolar protein sorting-associated protein 70 [Lyophyllum shimeji]|uniref:Vacuolar protein sorting-associated protein 70 n=1 Tax=Lyophyllum shimeji TaxID=47721 RepID=A0A9P3PE24_LYOSH|nr:putative vacuolar protein sorting-associated protein 70 [Lyophyllum shimeji]